MKDLKKKPLRIGGREKARIPYDARRGRFVAQTACIVGRKDSGSIV
jgi:hypothetical protein